MRSFLALGMARYSSSIQGTSAATFKDPYQHQIGEIQVHESSGNFIVFGSPEFSLWKYGKHAMHVWGHNNICPALSSYKTSGNFIPKSSLFSVSDSIGNLSLYALP